MARAIENVPNHCFNIHDSCGSRCNYKNNPDTYTHKTIGEGFKDQKLFEALKSIFNKLASKTNQFVAGTSSNNNENLNSLIVSKAPKSRLYGKSQAGDFRVACAISKKNDEEKYTTSVLNKIPVSPGKYMCEYNERVDSFAKNRYTKSLTRSCKLRRILLKKKKTELRHKNESYEGTTYETDVGLLRNIDVSIPIAMIDTNVEPIIVFFDLETGGFSKTSDVLQIAAKYEFSVYIKPTQNISDEASAVHGLRIVDGRLRFHETKIITLSLLDAIVSLYQFLALFGRKCILTAHNCSRLSGTKGGPV